MSLNSRQEFQIPLSFHPVADREHHKLNFASYKYDIGSQIIFVTESKDFICWPDFLMRTMLVWHASDYIATDCFCECSTKIWNWVKFSEVVSYLTILLLSNEIFQTSSG